MKILTQDYKMIHSAKKHFACLLWALIFGAANISLAQNASVGDLSASGTRPLADLADQLQKLTHTTVNFEEAPLESPADLVATNVDTLSGWRKLTSPRGGVLTVALTPDQNDAYTISQAILSAHASLRLGGLYQVLKSASSVSIVPTAVLGVNGQMKPVSPVMLQRISFPSADRTVIATLDVIAQSMAAISGKRVQVLTQPFHEDERITLGASGEQASEVIASLGKYLSYRLIYDPTEQTYYLNILPVSVNVPEATATKNGKKPIGGSSNIPFFIKQQP